VQTRLHERMIQHGVVFATHDEREASEIREHGPGAILPIEPQQRALSRKVVGSEVATDGRESLAQFLPVESVASVAHRAEPLVTVGLADNRAGPHDFPALAPRVASSTDLIQSARGRRQFFCLGQSALAGGFTCAIDIEDHPGASLSILQTACLPLLREQAAPEIVKKQGAQRFDWLLGQSRQKA